MRNAIWRWLCRNVPEGMIIPLWLRPFKAMLFPLQWFYWRMSGATGYQWETDVWLIEGVRYSGAALRMLSNPAKGQIYRINRTGDLVTLERVDA